MEPDKEYRCPAKWCNVVLKPTELREHYGETHSAVPCRYCHDGVQKQTLRRHEGKCSKSMVKCPANGCEEVVARDLYRGEKYYFIYSVYHIVFVCLIFNIYLFINKCFYLAIINENHAVTSDFNYENYIFKSPCDVLVRKWLKYLLLFFLIFIQCIIYF